VSSAILYAAIILIWACFLIPAWIRRPHAHPEHSPAEAEASPHKHAHDEHVEYVTETENDVDVSVEADIHVEVTQHEHAAAYADEGGPYASGYAANGQPYEAGGGDGGGAGAGAPGGAPRPSQSREQMLRARRRMLSILVAMTLVTFGFAYLGFVRWWICVPPAVMLVLYVLLLRTIAQADAEFARKRAAWERAQARAYARYMQEQAPRGAYEASPVDAGAQIIDISGRVSDQLYDQYADAAVRAVGD
jgi:hypothetical protein